MATAVKLPFSLSVIRTSYIDKNGAAIRRRAEATRFVTVPAANSLTTTPTISVKENEGVAFLFRSEDTAAKLYLPCLDAALDQRFVENDAAGDYITPSDRPFQLCGGGQEGLLVERMLFFVEAEGQRYYGNFAVLPRQLEAGEWQRMQEELEEEFEGLSRVWKKGAEGRGIGGEQALPLRAFRDLERLQAQESKVFAAIRDIIEQPRYAIKTSYEKEPVQAGGRVDAKSMRSNLSRGGISHVQLIPKKRLDYDIDENRMLRMMAERILARLAGFRQYTEDAQLSGGRMREFTETVRRYRHLLNALRNMPWYPEISGRQVYAVSQAMLADNRYYILYCLHLSLERDHLGLTMREIYRLSYQKSSLLYELWCYFKLRHVLEDFATETDREESYEVGEDGGFSLRDGSRVCYENEEVRLALVYNQTLGERSADRERDPLYFATSHNGRNHNHPDLLLHIFSKKTGWYVGSIILECKYRKVRQIWAGERSSLGQLETYYKNACSDEIYGGIGKLLRTNPVCGVMALTPDTSTAPIRSDHFPLETFALRPGKENRTRHALSAHIRELIEKALKAEEVFSR